MSNITRREFIQHDLALAATLGLGVRLPGSDDEPLEIALVGFGIDGDDFAQCIKLCDFHTTMKNGMYVMNVESRLDVKRALDAAYFIDANGNRYPYHVIERAVETDGYIYPIGGCGKKWADIET